jgi:hypothetical protein
MSKIVDEEYIKNHLINNEALFNHIYIIEQNFDIIPNTHNHYGASINYQDITELRTEFLEQLYDSIVDWIYGSEKYKELKNIAVSNGKSDAAASGEISRRAREKIRANRTSNKLLIQGQFGELLLFHFIQRLQKAIPLLRKMKITTSTDHERFGADAIHFKYEKKNPIIILGEAKTYTSNYKFNQAFKDAITSILKTYKNHRKEINLYVHEDFLNPEMNQIAEEYINNKLENPEVHLVCVVVYNETSDIKGDSREEIMQKITNIIKNKYSKFDKNEIDIENNTILKRITYIIFPIWELDKLVNDFQQML